MSRKTLIFIAMTVGSIIGGYIPVWFGAGLLSFTSLTGNAIGGIIGVVLMYKLTENF